MKRRAILQIGTEKTGTTTLQHFLARNRTRFAERGFVYPRFCGEINHTGLAAYALDPAKTDPIRDFFGATTEDSVQAMRARLRAAAADELFGSKDAIFCNEHCHSRLKKADEVRTLRDFLAEFFDEIQVSVYVRRQDQVALSLYSTRLKSGGVDTHILPPTDADDPYFNYDRSLSLWEEAFGRENVHVRLFDRRNLQDGSVVSDFLATWRLGAREDFLAVPDTNESIQPAAQEFLRRVNPHLRSVAGLPLEEVRGPLAARLAVLLPGQGARPGRAEAEAFYAKFRSSNEAVRLRHFPDRESLFDEDFSAYPEVGDQPATTIDEFVALAAGLHMIAIGETRRLEAEIEIRGARLHWERDEQDAAEAALRRALAWRPDHAAAYRTLAEYRLRQDRIDEAIVAAAQAVELDDQSFEYWHFLGMLHRRAGDFVSAASAQSRSLELNPCHAPSRREAEQSLLLQARAESRKEQSSPQSDGVL